jgi:hypothetical protein
MRKIIFLHASYPILLGVFLIVVVIAFEESHWSPAPPYEAYFTHTMKFLDHLSIAFVSLGAIGLILEFPHWHKYFYNLFVDTITNEAYIEKKSEDKQWLDDMQTKLMRAFFRTKDIEKPGGFYSYYRQQIQKFIGAPYRDEYHGTTTIQYSSPKKDAFHVTESISYTCCKLGPKIDPVIGWTARKDELTEMPAFKIILTPHGDSTPQVFEAKDGKYSKELIPDEDGGWGYTMNLDSYQDRAGLTVQIELEYVVALERPFSTNMRSISHGLTWTINHPQELAIFVDRFVSNDAINPEIEPGKCVFDYPEWLLPGDGIAFYLQKPVV